MKQSWRDDLIRIARKALHDCLLREKDLDLKERTFPGKMIADAVWDRVIMKVDERFQEITDDILKSCEQAREFQCKP